MDFLFSQDNLTSFDWILRAVFAFAFMLIVAKLMGQRSTSQWGLLDFVVVMLLGNILAHPLSDSHLGLKGSFITVSIVALLYILMLFLTLKSPKIRHYFDPAPMPLIKNGELLYPNLKKARVTIDHLLSELRKEKVDDAKKVALALWEPGGKISIFLYPQYEPATKQDINMLPKPFYFPRPIIKEGKIDHHELQILGKDTNWLQKELQSKFNTLPHQVLLATLDEKNTIKIFLYKE
ncbi:uncharacterized membrane protein YcaP [Bacillus oleivorans]|uniref:Uncharacterized membrane protein YcaP n=1 Tax=Bacillus oleivorans TaxID=1448271 RepID=A0A285D2J6_9BACI|nr:DUF421 domain-containing protein [Bacillus oleivorans]SNX74002.1 uncharacterized membrane protein YcaP [Bacillus oleivorans]